MLSVDPYAPVEEPALALRFYRPPGFGHAGGAWVCRGPRCPLRLTISRGNALGADERWHHAGTHIPRDRSSAAMLKATSFMVPWASFVAPWLFTVSGP